MTMDLATLLGTAAGTLTTVSFVPQVVRIWRTRSADDISYGMFLMFTAGVVLWLAYGVVTTSTPIVVANVVTLALALTVLVLKFRYSATRRSPGRERPGPQNE